MDTSTATSPPTWYALLWTGAARTHVRGTQVIPSRDYYWSCLFLSFLTIGGPLVTTSGGDGVTPGQNYVQIGEIFVFVYFVLQCTKIYFQDW